MGEKELYDILSLMNIPLAYDHFIQSEQSSVAPPFLLYRNTDSSTFKADDMVLRKFNNHVVDLITDTKDIEIEEELEDLFVEYHIPFDKFEDYIESEQIFQIRYFI